MSDPSAGAAGDPPDTITALALAAAAGRWSAAVPAPADCLGPTDVVESEAASVVRLGEGLSGDPWEVVALAFERVRDGIVYDFAPDLADRSDWRATATVARGHGFCQQKAVVLTAVLRSLGIPAALAFENLWDAKIKPPFTEMLGGQVLPWHGLVLVHLDSAWVRADVALDAHLCQTRHYRTPTFVRPRGAPLSLEDELGRPHFRTLRELAAAVDLPDAAVEGVMGIEALHRPDWKEEVRRRRASM